MKDVRTTVGRLLAAVLALGMLWVAPTSPVAAATGSFCCDSGGGGYNLAGGVGPNPTAVGQTVQAEASISPAVAGGTVTFYLGDACQAFCANQPAPTAVLGTCTPQVVTVSGTSDGECSTSFTANTPGSQGVYVTWTPPGGSSALTTEVNLSVTPGTGRGPATSGGSSSGNGGAQGGGSTGHPATAAPGSPSPFTDLGGVPWAASQIALLQAQGVVAGVSATQFHPDGPLTAEAALTLLSRLFLPAGAAGPTSPLPGVDRWAQAAVAWAQAQGVVHNAAAVIAAGSPAPRTAVAAWVVRALGLSCQCSPQSDLHFADAGAIPSTYLQDDTVAAVDHLFVGDAQGDFHPNQPITRAEMAVVLVRAEEALAEHGAGATPVTWTASGAPGGSLTWKGTAHVGTASLPVGGITGGTMSLRGPGGNLSESFLQWHRAGTATVRGKLGGQPGAVHFVWNSGTIRGGGGGESYSGSTAGGSLSAQSSSSCGSGCTTSLNVTVQTSVSGGIETANACGGGSQCLQYQGALLPGPAFLIADQFVAALAFQGASSTGGASGSATGSSNAAGASTGSPPGPSGAASAGATAQDEATVAAMYGDCAAFSPQGGQPCHGLFVVAATPDGADGTLYAIELNQQIGDGTGRGAVFFFDGQTLLTGTGSLPPQSGTGAGLSWVARNGISVAAPGHFAVQFVVSSGPNVCNACVGSAGTDRYVYGWNGSAMTLVSGTPPAPPEVIGG